MHFKFQYPNQLKYYRWILYVHNTSSRVEYVANESSIFLSIMVPNIFVNIY